MRKLLVLTVFLIMGSLSLHALTPSCDIFRKNNEGWTNANIGSVTTDSVLQQYLRSSQAVYEAWCGAEPADSAVRAQAVDTFVEAYRAERFSEVSNMEIRPSMGLAMLALIGLTRELPDGLQRDRRLREAWIQDCQDACFGGAGPTAQDARWQLTCGMQVRNDLMENLKPSPGVEAVKHMLWETPIAVLN
ncbi:MAG TPA: hypothetical protein VM554_13255 [Acidisarcina sp.]|nr:hypothetical protein [Acidisarcina sp.]